MDDAGLSRSGTAGDAGSAVAPPPCPRRPRSPVDSGPASFALVRPMLPGEIALVLDTWTRCGPRPRRSILRILGRAGVQVLVAAWRDAPEELACGWACIEHEPDRSTLHFVYVKHGVRRQGVANLLLSSLVSPVYYTTIPRFRAPAGWRFDKWQ